MEATTLREHSFYDRRADTFLRGRPDIMRSAEDTFDRSRSSSAQSNGRHEPRHNSIGIDALLRVTAHAAKTHQHEREWHGQTDGGSRSSSGPYQTTYRTRPSLPPLKNVRLEPIQPQSLPQTDITQVLADSMVSPPTTPCSPPPPSQPSPREPAYTTKTYKPPALYPSKRLRNDASSASVPRTLVDRSSVFRTPAPSIADSRFAASDVAHGLPTRPTSPGANQSISGGHMTPGPDYDNPRLSKHSYYVPAETADIPTRSYDHMRSGHDLNFHGSSQHGSVLRFNENPRSHPSREEARHFVAAYAASHEAEELRYRQMLFHSRLPPVGPASYEHARLPVGHEYEYSQQGKARKRSNLPKQSTEIMKTWFDRNISNPYPTEEQKLIFSNATGISMTQVSNWFINHRRRCPELRDKREKTRSGSEHDA